MSDDEATDLVMRLMAIPGRSGEEAAVMEAITGELRAAGVKPSAIKFDNAHKRSTFSGSGGPAGAGNLIVKLPGTPGDPRGKLPRKMLAAHADTVPICVGCTPRRQGGRVVASPPAKGKGNPATGLGADDRAGCAVVLSTAIALLRSGTPHPPLTLLFTVQEEVGLHGARNLAIGQLGSPRLAFNFDGGSPAKITLGATGGYRMTIRVHGLASHAGNQPQQGVSAVAIASLAVADLHQNGWHGLVVKGAKRGASNVGVISGGQATNVVTDLVTLRAEARSHDAKFRERIVREIEKAFRRAAKAVRSDSGVRGSVEFDGVLDYESFRLPDDDPSVRAAAQAVSDEGAEPTLAVTNGGIDANWLTARGVPTVTLGCGQRQIHTVGEELDLGEFHLARRVALRLATAG
ncbi:MAG: M20/M25/M40 family metallo-hydrolase [Planctomycetota bacterium]